MASDFDLKKDTRGEFYWVMNAANGLAIAKSSESYKAKVDCIHSIGLVKSIAPTAPIWDMTGPSPVKL